MDWNLFWTAFGAIGGTLGALATTAAVIVALWQTKYNYRKKLKLSFEDNITLIPERGEEIYHYVGVEVMNIGNRDVVIQNWGFDLEDGSKMMIVPNLSPIGRVIQVKLPYRLMIEEGITLYYEKKLFRNVLEENIKNGNLHKNKCINFYVTDSTAKKHYVKTNKTAQDLLGSIIEKNKKNSQNMEVLNEA